MTPAVPVLDAATVLPVRDGHDGLEVLMLRRNLHSGFVPGAYIFPGGALDPLDHVPGLDPFRVAAIRECFEEAGLLYALDADGRYVALDDRFETHRLAVAEGRASIADVCEAENLVLGDDALHYLARWITPEGAPRRYDTRFFVAAAPPEQTPRHDDREAIAHLWIRPLDALDRNRRGGYELILPTQRSLEGLVDFDDVDSLLDAVGRGDLLHEEAG